MREITRLPANSDAPRERLVVHRHGPDFITLRFLPSIANFGIRSFLQFLCRGLAAAGCRPSHEAIPPVAGPSSKARQARSPCRRGGRTRTFSRRSCFGVRRHVGACKSGYVSPHSKILCCREVPVQAITSAMNWPHAPEHWLFEPGLYIVTAGTYHKLPHLNSPLRLDFFLESLFECASEFGWSLRAWAVLPNHYHFVAASPSDPGILGELLGKLHMQTAKQLNLWDNALGRKVWFQFWDSHIAFDRSYLARLNYVHHNPARHGVVPLAENYRWCSASWFAGNASPGFAKVVNSFKTDRLQVPDDF